MNLAITSKTILVTGYMVPPKVHNAIKARGFTVIHAANKCLSHSALHSALDGASGYLIGGDESIEAAHIEQATNLEALAWLGTDFKANIPGWRTAYDRGVAVINSPGTNTTAVAEYTIHLMLSMARPPGGPGIELRGRTLGVIGMGRIGSLVAEIAKHGLGMRVAYYSPHRKTETETKLGIEYLLREKLLARSHVVSLHRPGNQPHEPAELTGTDLKSLRNDAIVINSSHGGLIDMPALLDVMRRTRLRVAVDDHRSEPVWDALKRLGEDRFRATDQCGYDTADANLSTASQAAEAVCDTLEDKDSPLVNNRDYRTRRNARRPS